MAEDSTKVDNPIEVDPMEMDADDFIEFMNRKAEEPFQFDSEQQSIESQIEKNVNINEEQDESKGKDANIENADNDDESVAPEEDDSINQEQDATGDVTEDAINGIKEKNVVVNETQNDYTELKQFRDKLTSSKIKVDGVEVEALSDPDAILKMQEAYAKSSKKIDAYDKNRPALEALKKSGLLDDKNKMALMIEAVNGNKDAIKTLLKESDVNPFELDMENIDASTIDASKHFVSDIELTFQDMIKESEERGIQEKLVSNVIDKWDNDSITKLLNDNQSKEYLLTHLNTGDFNRVQAEIKHAELIDFDGSFKKLGDFDKYAIASNKLAEKIKQKTQATIDKPIVERKEQIETVKTVKKINNDIDRLKAAKKASKDSEPVDSSTGGNKRKSVDLLDLDNDAFMQAMKSMM